MKLADRLATASDRLPVNPVTGAPSAVAHSVVPPEDGRGDSATGTASADGSLAGGSSTAAPDQSAAPEQPAARTVAVPVIGEGDEDLEAAIEHLRAILDSKTVASVVLGALLLATIGTSNPIFLLGLGLAGYVLLDRIMAARRCIVLGGSAWLLVMLAGHVLMGSLGMLPITIDYLFMFCGFMLALAVCGAFFAGRAMYYRGFAQGTAAADEAIARQVVDRLVEHPDDWGNLDGDYLEVESALNRVRDRERASAQALRDEARRKDDLVTYLAHDLKTPLASVVGYLSLLEEAPDLPAEQRTRFTGVALEKAHRLDTLIEEFFDITRFDFHDIVLTRGYVDLSLLLAQVADEFYPALSEQGKAAVIEAEPGLTALVDGDKMARVFNNIMRNAIAYSYEGSSIVIRAVRGGADGIRVTFENQGDPIPEPKRKLIFEKFYRLDAARATNRGGAGLGLAIAREIVSAHGGQIACESTPEHTVFTIDLPAK